MSFCIIVGSGSGISAAVARRFGAEGHAVGLIARRADALRIQAAELEAIGVVVHWRVADASNESELRSALAELADVAGPCDTLIYNAAVLRPALPLELTSSQLRQEFEVNVIGAHVVARTVVPAMVERGSGAVIFTGGGLALEPFPEWTSLALGKSALRSMAFSLFKDLAPKGVHVAVVAVCGIVEPGGPFDPDVIASEYWRLATCPRGLADRELIFQPAGTDPIYNDPERDHATTTVPPLHAR